MLITHDCEHPINKDQDYFLNINFKSLSYENVNDFQAIHEELLNYFVPQFYPFFQF